MRTGPFLVLAFKHDCSCIVFDADTLKHAKIIRDSLIENTEYIFLKIAKEVKSNV